MATSGDLLQLDGDLNKVYPLAVIYPLMAFLSALLCTPPFIWHLRNRNTGAASIMFWLLLLNFQSFLNGIIWPTDDIYNWWGGAIYCDIDIRLALGGTLGVPAAALCITRDLARALDTNRPRGTSDAQKRWKLIGDLALCFGLPLYAMAIYYVVQPVRYYIFSIQGCWPPIDASWVSIVLLFMWPLILSVASGYYACLILIRIYIYRRDFGRLLSSASTTRSRFIRLLIVSLLALCCFLPLEIYNLTSVVPDLHPYSWVWTHNEWNNAALVPTQGHVQLWVGWVWIACGYTTFAFFGLAEDAREMYRSWMKKAGVGKIFPSLVEPRLRSTTPTDEPMGWGSKAKLLFRKVGFKSSIWSTPSTKVIGKDSATSASTSYGRDSVLQTIDLDDKRKSKYSVLEMMLGRRWTPQARVGAADRDLEAGLPTDSVNEKL
jgi:pheromone a factor receptor